MNEPDLILREEWGGPNGQLAMDWNSGKSPRVPVINLRYRLVFMRAPDPPKLSSSRALFFLFLFLFFFQPPPCPDIQTRTSAIPYDDQGYGDDHIDQDHSGHSPFAPPPKGTPASHLGYFGGWGLVILPCTVSFCCIRICLNWCVPLIPTR